jgi:hypothetical protein
VFDPLVHGKNAQIARPSEAPVSVQRLKISQDLRVSICVHPNAIEKIGPGKLEQGLIDDAFVIEQGAGILAEPVGDSVDRSFHRGGHALIVVVLNGPVYWI